MLRLLLKIKKITGNTGEFTLSHRFFNATTFITGIASIFATIINIILELNIRITLLTVFSAVFSLIFFYFSRFKKKHKQFIIPFIIICLCILSLSWFANFGIKGPVTLVFLIALILIIIITEEKTRLIIGLVFLANYVSLLAFEKIFPELIGNYKSFDNQFYDVGLTNIVVFIMTFIAVSNIVNNYRYERLQVIKQKNKIIAQQNEITASIEYASQIQKAIFPKEENFQTFFKEYFILNIPRDVISGDFYFIKHIGNKLIIAVADSTGHGVPGGLMSVLGLSLLSDIIMKDRIFQPNFILESLRNNIKNSLQQTGADNEQKDGIDIALCVIDKENLTAEYAGAYNPLYILRDEKLIEYKATRNPIGIYINEKQFVNNELTLEENDVIYLFTDGYVDQLGGKKNEKYKIKRLRKLFLEIHDKPLTEQKEIMKNIIKKWEIPEIGQTDDILVVGLKI